MNMELVPKKNPARSSSSQTVTDLQIHRKGRGSFSEEEFPIDERINKMYEYVKEIHERTSRLPNMVNVIIDQEREGRYYFGWKRLSKGKRSLGSERVPVSRFIERLQLEDTELQSKLRSQKEKNEKQELTIKELGYPFD